MSPDRQRAEAPGHYDDWDKSNLSSKTEFARSTVGGVTGRASGRANSSVDVSVIEIAVMWILHHRTLSSTPRRSLVQDILEFYPVALAAIRRTESLRGAKSSDLHLVYFKGLIVAGTHPQQHMIDAIKRAERALDKSASRDERPTAPVLVPQPAQPLEDQDALAHIADALGDVNSGAKPETSIAP